MKDRSRNYSLKHPAENGGAKDSGDEHCGGHQRAAAKPLIHFCQTHPKEDHPDALPCQNDRLSNQKMVGRVLRHFGNWYAGTGVLAQIEREQTSLFVIEAPGIDTIFGM